MFANFDLF